MILTFSIIAAAEENFNIAMTVAFLLMLVLTVVYFAIVFPLERRKREIFQRNEGKFGEGEADALRWRLQRAWLRLQRAGNIMFASFLGAAATAGIALGIVWFVSAAEVNLFAAIGSCVCALLVPTALVSLLVWIVMYAVYRKKVRPTEVCLRESIRGERE